jgi:hypothetical protein
VYADGSSIETGLHQLTCVFREMIHAAASILMPALSDRPALQLVYPDHHNRLPWETEHNPSWREVQPLFMADQAPGNVETEFLHAALHHPLLADRRRHE